MTAAMCLRRVFCLVGFLALACAHDREEEMYWNRLDSMNVNWTKQEENSVINLPDMWVVRI